MFRYHQGQRVTLIAGFAGVPAGIPGIVWASYDLAEPAYEVTFATVNGDVDITLSEGEIRARSGNTEQESRFLDDLHDGVEPIMAWRRGKQMLHDPVVRTIALPR